MIFVEVHLRFLLFVKCIGRLKPCEAVESPDDSSAAHDLFLAVALPIFLVSLILVQVPFVPEACLNLLVVLIERAGQHLSDYLGIVLLLRVPQGII